MIAEVMAGGPASQSFLSFTRREIDKRSAIAGFAAKSFIMQLNEKMPRAASYRRHFVPCRYHGQVAMIRHGESTRPHDAGQPRDEWALTSARDGR